MQGRNYKARNLFNTSNNATTPYRCGDHTILFSLENLQRDCLYSISQNKKRWIIKCLKGLKIRKKMVKSHLACPLPARALASRGGVGIELATHRVLGPCWLAALHIKQPIIGWIKAYVNTKVPDPWHLGTDPNPRIRTFALFVSNLQDANKKIIFFLQVFMLIFFEGTFTSFLNLQR